MVIPLSSITSDQLKTADAIVTVDPQPDFIRPTPLESPILAVHQKLL